MSKSKSLRQTNIRLRDLKGLGPEGYQIDLWSVSDPPRSYEANACEVLVEGRELIISFGMTPPGETKPVTAISISLPLKELDGLMNMFATIESRLGQLRFSGEDLCPYRFHVSDLESMTPQTFARSNAQIVRAMCGDDVAIIDFYKRPLLAPALVESRPNERLEPDPVLRVNCPAAAASVMLEGLHEASSKVEDNE